MTTLMKRCRLAWAGLLLATIPMAAAYAQPGEAPAADQQKPVAVISVAPIQKLLRDVQYLADAAGQADFGRMAAIMSAPFTQGVDKTRPLGVVVMTNGQEFSPIGFLPISDMDSLMLIVKDQLGDPQDVGDGVKLLPTPIPVFVKEVGDWAVVAIDRDNLNNPPENPAQFLGDLPQQYDLAIQAYMQNVPELYRNVFIEQVRTGIEMSLEQEPGESDEDFAARKEQINKQLQDLNRMFTDVEDLTIGWNVDATQQGTYFDIKYTAVQGSDVAAQLELNSTVTSDYAGFINKEAAANLHFSQKIPEGEIERIVTQLRDAREQAGKQLEADYDLEGAEQQSAEKILDLAFDTLIETVRTGKLDAAAVWELTDDKTMFLSGAHVADGKRVEDGFKELLKLAEGEDVPEVEWDADMHQGVRIHVMNIPTDDAPPELKGFLGENPMLVLGVAQQSFYLAFGDNSVERLKGAIDQSLAGAQQQVSLMELHIALLPIMKTVQKSSEEPNVAVDAAVNALSGGSDKLRMTMTIDGLEARFRVLFQEGIIRAIGAGAAAQNAQNAQQFENQFEAQPQF